MKDKWIELYNQWLKKDSSQDERHELEKRALDDPFIADALEGIELYQVDGEMLQDRLEQRLKTETTAKVYSLWKYAAAASIAIIAGSLYFLTPGQELSSESKAYAIETTSPTIPDDMAAIDPKKTLELSPIEIEKTGVNDLISYHDQEVDVAELKVEPAQPTYTQRRKSAAEEIANEISITSDSDIEQSNRTYDHTSEISDPLAITRSQSIPVPAGIPVGSADSDDPMPIHEVGSAYANIPNGHPSDIYTDTPSAQVVTTTDVATISVPIELEQPHISTDSTPESQLSTIVSAPQRNENLESTELNFHNQAIPADLAKSVNILDQEASIKLSTDTVQIDTIIPNPENKIYDQFGDELDAYPLIGWAAFDSILLTEMPDKGEMFMRGLRDGTANSLYLSIDTTGSVIQFDSGAMPAPNIERVIKKTGTWHSYKKSIIVVHKHKIMSKKE